MDVESPKHLERLRDQPEIKAALLRGPNDYFPGAGCGSSHALTRRSDRCHPDIPTRCWQQGS